MTMMLTTYLASLSPLALLRSLPGACAQGLIWGLLALGVYITYKLLDFADLTVDGSMATGGAVAVMLIRNQAVSVDKYSLVVSLRYISDSTASKIRMFTTCILFCVVLVAILYWYFGTEQGHAIRATGCNQQMARAQGINTDFHTVLALMISNGLVGLSGGLYAQYQGAADVNMGRGAIVIGLAAVIIGDVLFGKMCAGKKIAFAYTLLSVIAGAILYYLVLSVVLWLKFPSDDLKLFSAIVVAIFLSIPYLKAKYSRKGVAK